MSGFVGFQQKVIGSRDGGSSSSLRLQTFEDKTELGASRTTVFLDPSCALCRMLRNCMTVEKKSNRNNKRTEIFILDRFVDDTGPAARFGILLDVACVKQRTQVHGWVHMNTRNCPLWRCHGRCG
jgi:hypothetical protein